MILKKTSDHILFFPTKMETWSDIHPFKKEKLFAALCLLIRLLKVHSRVKGNQTNDSLN